MGVTQEAATTGSGTTAATITSPQLPGLVQREACSCAPISREDVGLSSNDFFTGWLPDLEFKKRAKKSQNVSFSCDEDCFVKKRHLQVN